MLCVFYFELFRLTSTNSFHCAICLFWNSTFIWHSNVRLLPGFAYQLQQGRTRQVGFAGEIEGQTDKKLDEKDPRTPQEEGG